MLFSSLTSLIGKNTTKRAAITQRKYAQNKLFLVPLIISPLFYYHKHHFCRGENRKQKKREFTQKNMMIIIMTLRGNMQILLLIGSAAKICKIKKT